MNNPYFITPEDVEAMREWALDCGWLDYDEIPYMTPDQIMLGIQRNYDGGLAQFMLDGEA